MAGYLHSVVSAGSHPAMAGAWAALHPAAGPAPGATRDDLMVMEARRLQAMEEPRVAPGAAEPAVAPQGALQPRVAPEGCEPAVAPQGTLQPRVAPEGREPAVAPQEALQPRVAPEGREPAVAPQKMTGQGTDQMEEEMRGQGEQQGVAPWPEGVVSGLSSAAHPGVRFRLK